MSTSKRAILIVVRWATVVVAVGFLVFYVGQARRKRMEMFSGSKNARALFSVETQATENQLVPPAAGDQAIAPVPVVPPASSPPSTASKDTAAASDSFSFGVFPARPVTLGGSKSMSQPVMETSDMLRLWTLTPTSTSHHFGLPFLRAIPTEVTFGEPSIRAQADVIENTEEPPPTPPTKPGAASPVPAPQRTVP